MSSLEDKVLSILKNGKYVSGASIAKSLGVSRSLVHKAIESLRRKGFIIIAHTRLGYRLVEEDDIALAQTYVRGLGTRIRYSIHYLRKCTSTQDVADNLAKQGCDEGTVVICEEMSEGRGRLGRSWTAPRGGLWFTVVLRPPPLQNLQLLSLATGLAVAKSINELYGLNAKLKWPNDVLINEKKVCGVLIEAKAEADIIKYVLVGIGINVNNELPNELRGTATTLGSITGKVIPRLPLLLTVLKNLDLIYSLIRESKTEAVIKEWIRNSSTIGRYVRAEVVSGEVVEGLAVTVDRYGRLVIKTKGGNVAINAGDVYHLK